MAVATAGKKAQAEEHRRQEEAWMARVKVPTNLVVLFTRQLATMLRTGVPITHALDTLSHQSEYPNFGEVVGTISRKIGEGHSFSVILSRFPRVFPKVYVSMAQVGEKTGQLDDALERLAVWQERDFKLYQRVKGALTYPLFVLGLSAFLTLMLFYSVLPGFVSIFEEMNIELPWTTRMMVALTNAIKNPGAWLIAVAVLGGLFGWLRDYNKTPRGAVNIFRFLLKVPLLGTMLRFATTARYSSAVATLLSNGLDLPKSLKLGAEASGSPVMAADADTLMNAVMQGDTLSEYMRAHPETYVPTLTHMITAGEEASNLATMYERVASYYDTEVNFKIETLSAALEPILLCCVATVVGFVVLSIFIPMYSYLGKLGV